PCSAHERPDIGRCGVRHRAKFTLDSGTRRIALKASAFYAAELAGFAPQRLAFGAFILVAGRADAPDSPAAEAGAGGRAARAGRGGVLAAVGATAARRPGARAARAGRRPRAATAVGATLVDARIVLDEADLGDGPACGPHRREGDEEDRAGEREER